ncbi:MAG: glutathione S-transferase family protein [Rhizobiales bacterium]|nr:glutathione S-transferase family protein [Hyphomicrobiales bacterium]
MQLTFYSAWYCPFAQRAWIALEHLGVPYSYQETDPYHKTEHWLDVSRGTGQVPVLQMLHQDRSELRVPGSLRAVEYLDEIAPNGRKLMPQNVSARAEARFWIDHQNSNIIPYFYRFLKAEIGSDAARLAEDSMTQNLLAFTSGMSPEGPYFFGTEPGIVDFSFAPFALRIELLLSHYKTFQLPQTGEKWARYGRWWQAMKSHPSFVATMPELETYTARLLTFYVPYSQGGGQLDVTQIR